MWGQNYVIRSNLVYALEATFSVRYSWNLVRLFALIESRTILKMGHVGSKTGSLGQNLEKLFVLEATFSVWYLWNLVRMFAWIKSQTSLNMGHVVSETRSLGKIWEKPCVCPRGFIISLILMKLGQNVCLNEILYKFENVRSKTRSPSQTLKKTLCTL